MPASNAQLSPDFQKLFSSLTTAILLLDKSGNVAWMNGAAEDLLGISLRRAQGTKLEAFAPGTAPLLELSRRAIQEQQSFGRAVRLPSPQRDGSELELAARVSRMGDSPDALLLVELFNISQRYQLDKGNALITQHGVSRRIIRQLAHEIRNPLGGLRGAAQLLERELQDPSLREFTQVIIAEADRLAALMDNLLGPGRQPHMSTLNIHEILERVATVVQHEWPMQVITRDYDPSLPEINADGDQLNQAFLNILRNAAQASDSQGDLILRTRILSNQILNKKNFKLVALIEVEDTGPGVPEDIRDTLFYPLVSGREGGTGLGLPLAQDLVNRHHGLIEYESEPGRTVFAIQLPLQQPPPDV